MNEIEVQELINEIYSQRRKHKVEASILEALLSYNLTFPFAQKGISLDKFFNFKTYLQELGIETNFHIGTGPSSAFWQLAPNGLSNYINKKRKATLQAIIHS